MPKLGIPIIIDAVTEWLNQLKTVIIQSFYKSLSLNFLLPEIILPYFLVTRYLHHTFTLLKRILCDYQVNDSRHLFNCMESTKVDDSTRWG